MLKQLEVAVMQLDSIIEAACQALTPDQLYQSLVNLLPEVFEADAVSISLCNHEQQSLQIRVVDSTRQSTTSAEGYQQIDIDLSHEEYLAAVSSPAIWQPQDIKSSDQISRTLSSVAELDGATALVAPLMHQGKMIGTLNLASKSVAYGKTELDKFTQVSRLTIVALKRMHQSNILSAAKQRRHRLYAEHLEHLNVLGERLSLVSTIDDALADITVCARQLVNALRVSYCVLESDGKHARVSSLFGRSEDTAGQLIPLDAGSLADTLIHSKQSYATDLCNSDFPFHQKLGEIGINHVWSFPIICNGITKGALNIGTGEIDLDVKDATSVLETLSKFLSSTLQRVEAQLETLEAMREIEQQAKTDMLTALPNRTEFHRRLRSSLLSANSSDTPIGVLFLDLDLFKNINDTLGHDVGDELLCHISRRLEQLLKPEDTAARIGGDEFLLLLRSIESREALFEVGRSIIKTIRQPLQIEGRTLEVGVSVGAACYPADGDSAEALIKHADIAMYQAKALGRNQCQIFNDELAASVNRRVRLESYLREAICNDELSLVFQPQFDFATGNAIAVEALLRWDHPTEGRIPPDEFIGIAEQCGIINQITDWVLRQSLQAAKEFRRSEPNLRMAVNISACEFSSHSKLFERVTSALTESGLPSDSLELEITETALLINPDYAKTLIDRFSEKGIYLAIDDFGTGYASMTYLIQLPINTIKIDKSFVDGVESDVRKQSVVGGIIAIAAGMDLYIIGEGVETIEQLKWLNSHGCQCAQGYFLCKPLTAQDIPGKLQILTHYDIAA